MRNSANARIHTRLPASVSDFKGGLVKSGQVSTKTKRPSATDEFLRILPLKMITLLSHIHVKILNPDLWGS